MILFSEIFDRAVNLFDDPDIRRDYVLDPAGFQQEMRPFLINGLHKWTSPTEITDRLAVYSDPVGKVEIIDGEDIDTYALASHPVENSAVSYRICGKPVRGEYDPETNTVKIERPVLETEKLIVTWYYAGAFEADFKGVFRGDFNMRAMLEKVKNILAYGVLSAWGDVEMNRAIEMRNIFSDSDLGFYSPANSAKAKVEWHNQINHDMDTLISELTWRIGSTPGGGYRFGK